MTFDPRRAVERPSFVGAVGALIGVGIVGILSFVSPNGVGALVHAAPPITDASAPRSLPVLSADRGFDGQFYYRMAVSPFSADERVAGVRLDLPALRQQRVGYPIIARVVSLGDRDRVPAALAITNVTSMFALGWLGAALAMFFGRHAAWGLLFVLFPGFVYSIGFDLSEVVATTFVAGAVLALLRQHFVTATLLASCAVLTRETTAILPLALLLSAGWGLRSSARRSERAEAARLAVVGGVPLAILGAWQLWLRWRWDDLPLGSSADKNVRLPFQGLLDSVDKFFPPTSGAVLFRDVSLAFLVIVIIVGCITFRQSAAPVFVKVGFVLGAVVLSLLSGFPWSGATSFMRAGSELYFYAVLVVLGHHAWARIGGLLSCSTLGVFVLTLASETAKARP